MWAFYAILLQASHPLDVQHVEPRDREEALGAARPARAPAAS
jgi:hypothetical protein